MNTLVVPPLCLFVLAALGLLVARRRKRTGFGMVGLAAVLLLLLSIPAVAGLLLRSLECAPALGVLGPDERAQAIVILGADVEDDAPEYAGATVGEMSLVRLRYGARLSRQTEEPVLTTGGSLRRDTPSVGALMSEVLREELGVPTRWVENSSRNTWENAELSAPMLKAADIARIHLVTHAWHMRRARRCFEHFGFEVLPAPTDLRPAPRLELREYLPSAKALRESSLALHEWIGILWYRVRYR